MDKLVRKLVLAYVNIYDTITRYDKKFHKDFFYFKMIMDHEFDFRLRCYFELINEKKGDSEFKDEPYCHSLEMTILKLLEEGKLEYVEPGRIDITRKGYEELVDLRKEIDPIAPSVRYMVTRLKDPRYHQKYRNIVRKMKQKEEPY